MNYIFDNKTSEKETLEKMTAKAERVKAGLAACYESEEFCDCGKCPYKQPWNKDEDDDCLDADCSIIIGRDALEVIRFFTEANNFPDGAAESNEEVKTNESGTQE